MSFFSGLNVILLQLPEISLRPDSEVTLNSAVTSVYTTVAIGHGDDTLELVGHGCHERKGETIAWIMVIDRFSCTPVLTCTKFPCKDRTAEP